ncbi:hypothetical protein JOH51_000879 [Rhizobium leguminosarum]|nr:hypothetical protein [Rhizobium leguminosarum]
MTLSGAPSRSTQSFMVDTSFASGWDASCFSEARWMGLVMSIKCLKRLISRSICPI